MQEHFDSFYDRDIQQAKRGFSITTGATIAAPTTYKRDRGDLFSVTAQALKQKDIFTWTAVSSNFLDRYRRL